MTLSIAGKDTLECLCVDVLVAGGGVAGLRAALAAAEEGCAVLVVQRGAASSQFLHIVNAAFSGGPPENRPPAVFSDMMVAGGFINQPALVALCSHGAEAQVKYFENIGVPFVKEDGRLVLRQAAGSTNPHSIYTRDSAGAHMMSRMQERISANDSVKMMNNASLFRAAKGSAGIVGGYVWDNDKQCWLGIRARSVVLATGGASNLYSFTTQPPVNLGEGYSIALEAGAELVGMEFVCFEPLAIRDPLLGRKVMPTTLLKEGGVLRNKFMQTFMANDVPVSKDVISRAIHRELTEGRGIDGRTVLFDLRDVPGDVLDGYHDIAQGLKNMALEHRTALVPVAPAFHYLCGGVRIDADCRTSVPGLFAAGESCGGVHGAHRIAGGSGNEVMVTGYKAGKTAAAYSRDSAALSAFKEPGSWETDPELLRRMSDDEAKILHRVKMAMDVGAGIWRDADSLKKTLDIIYEAKEQVRKEGQALRTLLLCHAIVGAALYREESRGDHFRADFPDRDDLKWLGSIVTTLVPPGNDLSMRFVSAGVPGERLLE